MYIVAHYLLRWIFWSTVVILLNLIWHTRLTLGPFSIWDYHLDKKNLIFTTYLRWNNINLNRLTIDLLNREIQLNAVEGLKIHYRSMQDLLKLENFGLHYSNEYIKVDINMKTQDIGNAKVSIPDVLSSNLTFDLIHNNGRIKARPHHAQRCTIIPLNYNLNGNLMVKLNLLKQSAVFVSDHIKANINWTNGIQIEAKSAIKTLKGDIKLDWRKDLEIKYHLDRAELLYIIPRILKVVLKEGMNSETDVTDDFHVHISGLIHKAHFAENYLRNLHAKVKLSSGKLYSSSFRAFTNNKKRVFGGSNNYGPITIRCEKADDIVRLINSSSFIVNGKLKASINVNQVRKRWSIKLQDVGLPYLRTGNIRSFVTPVKLIRNLVMNPDLMKIIESSGYIDGNKLIIDSINGVNDYYKLLFKGEIDLEKSMLELTGVITSRTIINSIAQLSSIDILKDIITLSIIGNLNDPKVSVILSPGSILTTLLQTII